MTLVERINDGIKEAMKSRDQIRLNTLRMLKSKILAVDARSNLSDGEIVKLFKTYYGSLTEALEQAKGASRADMVKELEAELTIIQEFIPKSPSPEETKKLVIQAISDSGAKTKKDIGLMMKSLMKLSSNVDGKLAKSLADQLLSD